MDPPNDTTEKSAEVGADPATSTETDSESDDETGSFIFGNDLESDGAADTLPDRDKERVVDIVRLQPTKNADLQDQWGIASGSDVHRYLESQLKEYYYRDDDGHIRATEAAEEFVQNHQDVYLEQLSLDQESMSVAIESLHEAGSIPGNPAGIAGAALYLASNDCTSAVPLSVVGQAAGVTKKPYGRE